MSLPAPHPLASTGVSIPAFSCPLCQGTHAIWVYQDTELDFDPVATAVGETLGVRQTDYGLCETCATILQWPLPDEAAMAGFYQTARVYEQPDIVTLKDRLHADRLAYLQAFVPESTATILDVAAGDGRFLAMAHACTGWTCYGIEPFHPGAQGLAHPGITILDGLLADPPPDLVGGIDIVTSMHTLEHVADPREFLTRLTAWVKPGGWLYLEVPSTFRGDQAEQATWGNWIFKGHLFHFSAPGLADILATLGLSLVDLRHTATWGYPSLQLMARRIATRDVARDDFLRQVNATRALFQAALERLKTWLVAWPNLVLWGAGVDLHKVLLQEPTLLQAYPHVRLVDSNPAKHGKLLMGCPIHPATLLESPHSIVVTPYSRVIAADILSELRQRFPQVTCRDLFAPDSPR